MSSRARAISHTENQGPAAAAMGKRAVGQAGKGALQPRAALGTINTNRLASSSTEQPAKEQILKPARLGGLRNVQPKEVAPAPVPAPKKAEDVAEKMDMSVVADEVEVMEAEVEDIDAEDVRNPQLVTGYVNDIYRYLRHLEVEQGVAADYLAGQAVILPKMRGVLVDWLVGVHLQFHLLQETLFTTVAILDRFLMADVTNISRQKLQLVGVAAMLIAAKYEEIYAPVVKDFVYITDHAYTEKDILKMEIKVLSVLKFDLGRPLPLHFLRRASKAGGVDTATHTLAKYIVELSLGVYSLCHIPPSKLSAAALALAMRLLEPGATLATLWGPSLHHYTRYTMDQLFPVVVPLAEALFMAPSSKHATVYTKYTNKKFMKISRIPVLEDPVLRKIAKGEML